MTQAEMNPEKCRERLKLRCQEKGLKINTVESLAGLKRTHLNDYLSGKKNSMKDDAWKKIAPILDVTDVWLRTGLESSSVEQSSEFRQDMQRSRKSLAPASKKGFIAEPEFSRPVAYDVEMAELKQRLKVIEVENIRLKQLLAEQLLANSILREGEVGQ